MHFTCINLYTAYYIKHQSGNVRLSNHIDNRAIGTLIN